MSSRKKPIIDETKHIQKILQHITDKINVLQLPDYIRSELDYILKHLNLYKLNNLKANLRHLILMLKKIHKQHQDFEKKTQSQIKQYLHHEYQTFFNKIRTLINLNISELAHTINPKHFNTRSESLA